MMIKKISGRHAASGLVGVSVCLLFCNTAFAWQQEYIVSDAQSNTMRVCAGRYDVMVGKSSQDRDLQRGSFVIE